VLLLWRGAYKGSPVHDFIVLNPETSALQPGSSSQLYFADEENLGRRINNLEAIQFTTLLFVDSIRSPSFAEFVICRTSEL
jgi:hypothetical protein